MWEDLFQVVSSSRGMLSWQKWWSQKLSPLYILIQTSDLMPQAFLNWATKRIEKINVNNTSKDKFALLLQLIFNLLFFSLFSHSGKYYIILVWVFNFIVALSPFYSIVINCCCCKFMSIFYKEAHSCFERSGWVWEDSWLWNLNHLSRWRVASLKK